MFTAEELLPIKLTLELALITTVFLLLVATPLAWWLSHTKSKWRAPISSIVTLPLVLPPSVLGFYLLVAMGPSGPLGKLTEALGIGLLTFTFPGLVIGSIVYSMPFSHYRRLLNLSASVLWRLPLPWEPNRLTPFLTSFSRLLSPAL